MFGQSWYFDLIKKYTILFGALFNDISIIRVDSSNTQSQVIKVPISYSPKERMQARIESDPDIDRPYAVLLPRMAFDITSMTYGNDRKLETINKVLKADPTDPSKIKYQYMCVPWDINFSLYIYAKNMEDGTKILEQILPFFTPVWTTKVDLIPEMDETRDIPVTIGSISPPEDISVPNDLLERTDAYLDYSIPNEGLFLWPNKNYQYYQNRQRFLLYCY